MSYSGWLYSGASGSGRGWADAWPAEFALLFFVKNEVKKEEMGMRVMVSPNLPPLTFTLADGETEVVDVEV